MLNHVPMSDIVSILSNKLVATQLQLMPILVVIVFGDYQSVIAILPLEVLVIGA